MSKTALLSKLRLRFGSAPGAQPLEFVPGPMTVFVGPNNSGKSLTLAELGIAAQEVASGRPIALDVSPSSKRIVQHVELADLRREDIVRLIFGSNEPEAFDRLSTDRNVAYWGDRNRPGIAEGSVREINLGGLATRFDGDWHRGPIGGFITRISAQWLQCASRLRHRRPRRADVGRKTLTPSRS